MKDDALVARGGYFFRNRQQHVVVNMDLCSLTLGRPGGVDGRVAAADHRDAVTKLRSLASPHLVKIIEPIENTVAIFAGNVEAPLLPGTGGQVDRVEAVQLRPGHGLTKPYAGVDRDAERGEYLKLSLKHCRR